MPKPHGFVPRKLNVPLRLPERKYMTIAAGFVCHDGIVLCADSQEVSGDYKWPVKKLVIPQMMIDKTRIMIAGAGFGPAIDTATQEIISLISMSQWSYEQTIWKIEGVLREIHEKDLPNHPLRAVSDLEFKLLIAFQAFDGGGLFVTSGSLVSRVDFFEVIGSGEVTKFFAHMMYRKTSWDRPILGLSEGTVLASYLIHLAKNQLSSIGGRSQIATLNYDGELNFASEWDVPRWESFFSDFQYHSNAVMLDCADPTTTQEAFDSRLDTHVAILKATKAGLIKEKEEWESIWKPV